MDRGNTLGKGKKNPSNMDYVEPSPYDLLDDLFHDDETEIIAGVLNKYIAIAIKSFLEDLNFDYYGDDRDLDNPILSVDLEKGMFRFITHMEDKITLELPVEWDVFDKDIRSYVNDNPIVKKEIERKPDGWNTPTTVSGQTTNLSVDKSPLEKSMESVKDHVKMLQDKFGLDMDEIREALHKYKNIAVHSHNKTMYGSKGDAEMHLKSGIYNHVVDIIKTHGWEDRFKESYGMPSVAYMREHGRETDIEKRLLSEFGFEYCLDNIVVDENPHWNNRVIEVKYKDQTDKDFDIDFDMSVFEKDNSDDTDKLND